MRPFSSYLGKSYYVLKADLLKRGFSLVKSQMNSDKTIGIASFDCGCSLITIKTTIFRNPNTHHLNCGKLLEIKETIYD